MSKLIKVRPKNSFNITGLAVRGKTKLTKAVKRFSLTCLQPIYLAGTQMLLEILDQRVELSGHFLVKFKSGVKKDDSFCRDPRSFLE